MKPNWLYGTCQIHTIIILFIFGFMCARRRAPDVRAIAHLTNEIFEMHEFDHLGPRLINAIEFAGSAGVTPKMAKAAHCACGGRKKKWKRKWNPWKIFDVTIEWIQFSHTFLFHFYNRNSNYAKMLPTNRSNAGSVRYVYLNQLPECDYNFQCPLAARCVRCAMWWIINYDEIISNRENAI